MNDDVSARLGLPYLAAGQLQKHVTLNEALTRLDALIQTAVVSRATRTSPPIRPRAPSTSCRRARAAPTGRAARRAN